MNKEKQRLDMAEIFKRIVHVFRELIPGTQLI